MFRHFLVFCPITFFTAGSKHRRVFKNGKCRQHDTQKNNIGRHNRIATLNIAIRMQLSDCKICSAILIVIIAKCHYAERRYSECCYADHCYAIVIILSI